MNFGGHNISKVDVRPMVLCFIFVISMGSSFGFADDLLLQDEVNSEENITSSFRDQEDQRHEPLTFKSSSVNENGSSTLAYLTLLLALVLVIAILFTLRKKLMHSVGISDKNYVNLIERKRIGVNTWVSVIAVDGTKQLIVENNTGIAIQAIPGAVSDTANKISKL